MKKFIFLILAFLFNIGNNFCQKQIDSTNKGSVGQECDTVCINNKIWCNHKFDFGGILFSDFVGIDDDQPNGLIQTNIYFSYTRPTRTRPKIACENSNETKSKGLIPSFYWCRNIVLIDLTLSKIGNQNQELPVRYLEGNNQSYSGYFNRFDLIQYANVLVGAKLNIFTLKWPNIATLYLDFMPIFYNTSISDSLRTDQKDKKTSVSTIAYGGNIKFRTAQHEKTRLSAEISYTISIPQLYSTLYSDKVSNQIKENRGYIKQDMILETKQTFLQVLDLRIKYSPKDKDKKIDTFFRFSVFQNVIRRQHIPGNAFAQFQLGVSTTLDEFFNKSKSNDQ